MRHSRSLRWLVVMVVVLAVHAAIFAGLMQWRSASSVPQTNGIEVQAETSSAAVGQGGEDAKNPAIESVNMSMRKLIKNRWSLPSDETLLKLF